MLCKVQWRSTSKLNLSALSAIFTANPPDCISGYRSHMFSGRFSSTSDAVTCCGLSAARARVQRWAIATALAAPAVILRPSAPASATCSPTSYGPPAMTGPSWSADRRRSGQRRGASASRLAQGVSATGVPQSSAHVVRNGRQAEADDRQRPLRHLPELPLEFATRATPDGGANSDIPNLPPETKSHTHRGCGDHPQTQQNLAGQNPDIQPQEQVIWVDLHHTRKATSTAMSTPPQQRSPHRRGRARVQKLYFWCHDIRYDIRDDQPAPRSSALTAAPGKYVE